MHKLVFNLLSVIFMAAMYTLVSSCDDNNDSPTFPFHAEIYSTISGSQVAFQGLTHSAVGWSWDFGDGKTSTEQNPVHVYEQGGYYVATLTAKDSKGATITKTVDLAVNLRPYDFLVGDHTAEGYKGKTWKLTKAHSGAGDYLANADAALTSATPYKPIPDGIFASSTFGMGPVYDDTYTFFYDGSYAHDVKEDGGAFGGFVYQYVGIAGGNDKTLLGNLVKPSATEIQTYLGKGGTLGKLIEDIYGLCIARYTPESGAKFTLAEGVDITVPSVYGGVSFKNTMTLDFTGTEFIGFRDFQRKVIVRSINNTRMQVVMFMAAATSPAQAIGVNTHALILTFEAVTE